MIREKIHQAVGIMQELGIDAWLIFGRESHTSVDPCVPLVVGTGYTWSLRVHHPGPAGPSPSSAAWTRPRFKRGDYATVITYVGGVRDALRQVLAELDPATIASITPMTMSWPTA